MSLQDAVLASRILVCFVGASLFSAKYNIKFYLTFFFFLGCTPTIVVLLPVILVRNEGSRIEKDKLVISYTFVLFCIFGRTHVVDGRELFFSCLKWPPCIK